MDQAPARDGHDRVDGGSRAFPSVRSRHPRALDALVILTVFLYNLPIQVGAVPPSLWSGAGILVSLGLCLPGLWRRQRPVATWVAIQGVALVQTLVGIDLLVADAMLLLAVYTLSSRRSWQLSGLAALTASAWAVVTCWPVLSAGEMSIGDVGVVVALVLWAWTWGRLVQTRGRYVGALQERAVQLEREKAVEAELAASAERTRIAREIHDVVSHSLTVVTVLSDGAAATVDTDPEQARSAMLTVRDTGRAALADMRRMLGVLRDDEPGSHSPQPGLAQLGDLLEESRAAGLRVDLVETGERRQLPQSIDLTVYRIVQEALTNVRKHAGSGVSQTRVRLEHQPEAITVMVRDDGAGAAAGQPDGGHEGHGLVGMRERVATHHGHLSAGPHPDGGFEVVATIPTGEES